MAHVTQKQYASGCKHFNGIQNDECKAGVNYNKMFAHGPLPCRPFHADNQYRGVCPAFEWSTIEEIAEHERLSAEAAAKFFNAMIAGKCPTCGAEVVSKRQLGRCVYGEPCGHRLYQGKLDPTKESDDKS